MKTQTETQHAPTPWIQKGRVVEAGEYMAETINPFSTSSKTTMEKLHRVRFTVRHEEDAAFIVRAVNSHEQMLWAIKHTEKWLVNEFPYFEKEGRLRFLIGELREAIAKAEGK